LLIKQIQPAFRDERGDIADIASEIFDHATIIHSHPGAVRGNHYHKETTQYTYIVSGKTIAVSEVPGEAPTEMVLQQGDLLISLPGEYHAFESLEESTWLVLTRGPRGGQDYETDTYRLDQPLL